VRKAEVDHVGDGGIPERAARIGLGDAIERKHLRDGEEDVPGDHQRAPDGHGLRVAERSSLARKTVVAVALAPRYGLVVRAALVVIAIMVTAAPARAQDRFEIQVYDADTAAPGQFGVEHHVNVVAQGRPAVEDGELPTDRVLHVTFEPHVGLASWCEAGAYLQTALRPEGAFDYAGAKLRFKARVPRRLGGLVGLALNLELSSLPARYEAVQLAVELRPILDVRWKRLWVSVNPIVGLDLRGAFGGVPRLEPAAAALVAVGGGVGLGVEWYAAFGPVTAPANEAQRLFGVVQWAWRRVQVHTAVGYGFVTRDDRWIVKAIVSVDLGSTSQ